MRSDTSSPASRRACCTTRTTSRAVPSAASSGVTVVSSSTRPALPGKRGGAVGVHRDQALGELPRLQRDPRGRHGAVRLGASTPPP